jgi:hypothetical protein
MFDYINIRLQTSRIFASVRHNRMCLFVVTDYASITMELNVSSVKEDGGFT